LASGFFAAMGDVAQVPTQWSPGAAAKAMLREDRVNRVSRRRNRFLEMVVMTVLIAIGLTLQSYRCFIAMARSRIVASAAGVRAIQVRNEPQIGGRRWRGNSKHDDEMAKGYAA
jgi:hypothetical protein